jgi:hypothetical protein
MSHQHGALGGLGHQLDQPPQIVDVVVEPMVITVAVAGAVSAAACPPFRFGNLDPRVRARIDAPEARQLIALAQHILELRDTLSCQCAVFIVDDGDGRAAIAPVDDGLDDRREEHVERRNPLRRVEQSRSKRVRMRPRLAEQFDDLANPARCARQAQDVDHAKERLVGQVHVRVPVKWPRRPKEPVEDRPMPLAE